MSWKFTSLFITTYILKIFYVKINQGLFFLFFCIEMLQDVRQKPKNYTIFVLGFICIILTSVILLRHINQVKNGIQASELICDEAQKDLEWSHKLILNRLENLYDYFRLNQMSVDLKAGSQFEIVREIKDKLTSTNKFKPVLIDSLDPNVIRHYLAIDLKSKFDEIIQTSWKSDGLGSNRLYLSESFLEKYFSSVFNKIGYTTIKDNNDFFNV